MLKIQRIDTAGVELDAVRRLFAEYEKELGEDLCFQQFAAELENPLVKYGPPGGVIFLALDDGLPAGCIALQPLKEEGVCEMKRLYVPADHRKKGIGEQLVTMLLDEAKRLGYHTMKLDTLLRLQPAIRLYHAYGFTEAPSYYPNPLPNVVYMHKKL